jgi:hypothetical protein
MKPSICATAWLVCSMAAASPAQGQQMTEQFIPIGRSPGLSGRVTTLGTIEAVDAANRVLTVSAPGAAQQRIGIGERTWIWIDRSRIPQTNLRGSLADLQPGRRVEVKPVANDPARAEWVKVEAAQ